MPWKVNFGGVMPIIFAGSIMMFPPLIFQYLHWYKVAAFFAQDSWGYMFTYGVLIFLFSYFWVGTQFNPIQISENLKKEGAYIPGISPGQPTADFLDSAMTRVTTGGAVFLLVLALFPMFLFNTFGIPFMVAQFFGGTSLLIMVGVVLDTMSQLESHLTMRHYDGFLKSGRLRSRSN
jgi:preprotein translocase subunit SecY